MDHESAIELRAAERCRAGELSPAGRDAFEERFFSCPKCAEAVRFELAFAANARAAVREQEQHGGGRLHSLSATALACMNSSR
ncbi:MAG: hypothetical protein ACE15B_00975 [Bryobacteraceae bacterium]